MTQAIPIYVVNLARAAQRRADLSTRLAQLGLNAQFPPVLDAQEVATTELMKGFVQWGPWGALRAGDIACSQSHRRLWRAFLASNAPYALILEGDVVLSDTLPKGLRVLQSNPARALQRGAGIEQMPMTMRPSLPRLAFWKQELNRGLRELGFGTISLIRIAFGRAKLFRLSLAPGMGGAE